MKLLFLACLSLLCSCQQSYLTVQTDYISYKNLASYYVGTPDPRLNCPLVGQRLIISWSVPKTFMCYADLHLEIVIRFRNGQELTEFFDIEQKRGTYVYHIINDEYIEKQGILTYRIDIVGGGCPLEQWRHRIWAELIEIPHQECAAPEQFQAPPAVDWNA